MRNENIKSVHKCCWCVHSSSNSVMGTEILIEDREQVCVRGSCRLFVSNHHLKRCPRDSSAGIVGSAAVDERRHHGRIKSIHGRNKIHQHYYEGEGRLPIVQRKTRNILDNSVDGIDPSGVSNLPCKDFSI